MFYSGKMLNFFDRKTFRKILKRKDSDAGERGTFSLLRFFLGVILQCSCDMIMGFADSIV